MNCKPGDLAIVVRDNFDIGALGKLVEVLYLAPPDKFQLPNGQWNVGSEDRYGQVWVIRILGEKLTPPNCWFQTEYGTGADSALRPLPGLTQDEHENVEAVV